MRKYIIHIISAFLLLSTISCKRQLLEDPYMYMAYIPITIDWSESNVLEEKISNVSIYFFPTDGGSPYLLISGDPNFALAKLPIGSYTSLIFNEAAENFKGVTFDNIDNYKEYEANIIELPADKREYKYYKAFDNDMFVVPHDRLGAWRLGSFEVTKDMVEYTRSDEFIDYIEETKTKATTRGTEIPSYAFNMPKGVSVDVDTKSVTKSLEDVALVKPQPVTALNTITLKVKNLNNAMSIEGVLRGSASGAVLESNVRIPSTDRINVYEFKFGNRKYDDSANPCNGTMISEIATFGKHDIDKYELFLNVILTTGELVSLNYDVTKQINDSPDFDIKILIDGIDGGGIDLPEYNGPGFGVDDWEDNEEVLLN